MITVYGVGTIVGGGFYALCGKVVGEAGMLAPCAFLVAALIATFSVFSFAELSSRFPVSGGEARYVQEAFPYAWLSTCIGWMVIATGVVSAATLADAFAMFCQRFVNVPSAIVVATMVLGLGIVTARGIRETAWLALAITVVEVGGLLLILIAGAEHLGRLPSQWRETTPNLSIDGWKGVFLGAFLAFYSFVGFEDMVNVAEEVRKPERNLPVAILLALAISAILYICVATVLVCSAPVDDLAQSDSPLAYVFGDRPYAGDVITLIGMLAGLNGALVQIVMASRFSYGLAKSGQGPGFLSRVNEKTRTPLEATVLIVSIVLVLALWLPLESLAKVTSTLLLIVYGMVNLSLVVIKRRQKTPPEDSPCYPIWLPITGSGVCAIFLLLQVALG